MSNHGKTPVRAVLKADSPLGPLVQNGLGAVQTTDRRYFADNIRPHFGDSIDIDAAFKADNPEANRWDYLLGHTPSGSVIGVEPHSAKEDQISTVIKKREMAKQQLQNHLREKTQVKAWLWVTSGRAQFLAHEKACRRLDQNGITFVGNKVLAKHLPSATTDPSFPGHHPTRKGG